MVLQKLQEFDSFGATPSLNFQGKKTFKTLPGAIVTLCLYTYMLGVSLDIFRRMYRYEENEI